ncbi:MAG: gliding motility-associated C-terminal domain-containing protein, partial [Bacteroidota bacterium]
VGGVPTYDYFWNTGSSDPVLRFLAPDAYTVIVVDANGCEIEQEFSIEEPAPLVATAESTDADEGCNGTVTILPIGGSGSYSYRWESLPNQGNNPVARGLCPGIYSVEVFDNCQSMTVTAEVRDRRFPCLSDRSVITPNGDGLNESFILFCTDGSEANENTLEIYNRWGQLVFQMNNYSCSSDGGLDCFEGRTNDGAILPEGPYYYVLDYFNPIGERLQKRGSLTIVLD